MNSEDRAFPVTIDPQIKLSNSSAMTTYSYENGNITSSSLSHAVGVTWNGNTKNVKRMYMTLKVPTLPRNPRIKKAELVLTQSTASSPCADYPTIGLYSAGTTMGTNDSTSLIDYAKMKLSTENTVTYSFDITALVDSTVNGENTNKNLVLRMTNEAIECDNEAIICGSSSGTSTSPKVIITY
jgi:hypothetical protein